MTKVPPVIAATGPFFMFSLAESLELIAEAGFDGVEPMITQERASQDPERLRALAARHGLAVPAVHGPFLLATWLVFGTDPRLKLERCLRFAEAAQVPTVIIHPPYRWQVSYAGWLRERVARAREETGVTVAVENMFPVHARGRSLRFHMGIEPEELAAYEHVTLDLSHLAVSEVGVLDAYEALRDRVAHVHVSNNSGRGRDSHAALDQGVLPVAPFLERLGADRYDGAVCLELDVRPWADDRAALLAALRGNLAIARRHLAAGAGAAAVGRGHSNGRR